MPTLIVAATSRGAGKTAMTAAVSAHLSSGGRTAWATQAWDGDADGNALQAVLGDSASKPVGKSSDTVATVAQNLLKAIPDGSIAVVEGKTAAHADNLALAEAADALVLLVASPGDDILASASSYGSRLAGVIINPVPPYQVHDVENRIVPELQQANIRVLGWVPEDRRLLAPTLDLVAKHLGAEIMLNEENAGNLIDNFLIGGMVLDWGPFYFGSQENVGVIVRGDRPDIQLSALQTDTLKAMVLTKGARPVEYVVYEATQRGVPVVLTSGTTEETATQLESLLEKIRFDHPDKLVRMQQLADERLDLDAIADALSQPATR